VPAKPHHRTVSPAVGERTFTPQAPGLKLASTSTALWLTRPALRSAPFCWPKARLRKGWFPLRPRRWKRRRGGPEFTRSRTAYRYRKPYCTPLPCPSPPKHCPSRSARGLLHQWSRQATPPRPPRIRQSACFRQPTPSRVQRQHGLSLRPSFSRRAPTPGSVRPANALSKTPPARRFCPFLPVAPSARHGALFLPRPPPKTTAYRILYGTAHGAVYSTAISTVSCTHAAR
jgi:hypothetical protein